MIGFGRRALTVAAITGSLLAPGWAAMSSAAAQDATPAADCAELDDATMASMAEAWTDHSFTAENDPEFAAMLSPDLVYHTAAFGVVDQAGWLEGRKQLEASFPGGTIAVNETIIDAPFAVTHWTASAVFGGEFMGTPPTGEPVEWDGIGVYRFDCGKIVEAWTALDQYGRLDPVTPEANAATPPAPACAEADAEVPDADAAKLAAMWWDSAWNETDAAALADVTADDVLHHWAMGPDTVGDAAIAERIAAWRTAMPDLTITAGDLMVDGNLAAARWTASGTDTGGVMGNPPTGKHAEWDGINIFRMQCGEITEVWSEMDAVSMMTQLGS